MLTLVVFLPAVAALVLAVLPRPAETFLRVVWTAVSVAEFALVIVLWIGYRPSGGFGYVTDVRWVPSLDSGYHVGVDGLSLPLIAVTTLLFAACAVHSWREQRRPRGYACLFLLLETSTVGLFSALDLVLFFVFFDLSIVLMYFVIAGWGHEQARRAATKFFLYTFLGSLALLLGFIGLFLAARPYTFDIVTLTRLAPLHANPAGGALVLLAIGLGFAVKTPTVPFHTWLPLAHTEAPTPGSVILAGVLLKMGTYGFLRIALPILPDTWRRYAVVFVVIGVVSVLYGALVALAQQDFKRMIAYTSVNHMGYVVLAVGVAGLTASSAAQARTLAVAGAITQMVSHALITGALFLLAGALHERGRTYRIDAYGGLAARAPVLTAFTVLAALASLGLPGFSGFVAEFQIFTGGLGAAPVATGLAIVGIVLITAVLMWAFRRIFLGSWRSPVAVLHDVSVREAVTLMPLLAAALVIGVLPRFLLDVVEPAARTVVGLVAR